MITPKNLQTSEVVDGDYRYACSLTLMRTFQVSNPEMKCDVQTEFVVGVLGPAAFGKETQVGMHRMMRCQVPLGWNTQLGTAALVNINLVFEKGLRTDRFLDWIGGVKFFTGTSMNAVSVYTVLRAGKMNPYFGGLFSNYRTSVKSHWQLIGTFRPSLDFIAQNAHVEGNLFRYGLENDYPGEDQKGVELKRTLNHTGFSMEYGVVISWDNFSMSLTQRSLYALINEQPRHMVGNLSFYILMGKPYNKN